MAQQEPSSKRLRRSIISDHLHTSEFQEIFSKHWHDSTPVKTQNLEIIPKPFRVCKISNFLPSQVIMDEIKNELQHVKSRRNSIDLYQFEQTKDLASAETRTLRLLYDTFQTDLVSWMERNTKIKLKNKISISSSCYSDTDFLLCHDDNMGDRRIAFVLYLSENWEAADGGSLDLFDADKHGLPRNVVHSLVPEYNSFVFFEVTEKSFHQVAEVTSVDKSRWSINGWFHGPRVEKERPPRLDLQRSPLLVPENLQFNLNEWISESYLVPTIVKDIKRKIESESFTFLSGFLRSEVFQELSEELTNEKILWKKLGPADLRNYEIAVEETLPEKLKEFCKLLKSIVTFKFLKRYTQLDLLPDGKAIKPTMRLELQRWSAGCYTLLSDVQVNDSTSCTTDKQPEAHMGAVEEGESTDQVLKPKSFSEGGSGDNFLREVVNTPSSSGDETDADILKRALNRKSPKSRMEVLNLHQATSSNVKVSNYKEMKPGSDSEEADVEDNRDNELRLKVLNRKSLKSKSKKKKSLYQATSSNIQISPSKFEMNRGTDSEESDIEDYMSDHDEDIDDQKSGSSESKGSLDLIMQFNTGRVPDSVTIDYVNPGDENALIHVPAKDNHLCLVYKSHEVSRVHNYVNHYCEGYYYNMLCTYYE